MLHKMNTGRISATVTCFLTLVIARSYATDDDVTVNTTLGLVRGFSEYVQGTKVHKYLGIPYAAPPVGDLRFRDPQRPLAWTGTTHNATGFTPHCARVARDLDPQDDSISVAEDCLYLNVFVPEVSILSFHVAEWNDATHFHGQ